MTDQLPKKEVLRRLRRLKDILRKVPKKQFNMLNIAQKTKCGTVGCLLGWAGLDPEFRKLGLKTNVEKNTCQIDGRDRDYDLNMYHTHPFFGITEKQEVNLFFRWGKGNSKSERYTAINKLIREIEKEDRP